MLNILLSKVLFLYNSGDFGDFLYAIQIIEVKFLYKEIVLVYLK